MCILTSFLWNCRREKKDTKEQSKNNKRNHEKGPCPRSSIANSCVLGTFRSAVCRKGMSGIHFK